MTIDEADDPEHFVRLMDRQRKGKDDAPDQYDTVTEMLGISEGQRILDVGCGTGGAVRALADRVGASGSVVGVDSSLTMIGEAIRRSSSLRRDVEFHYGDVYQLPFADHSFDSCFALCVFEILDNPEQAIKEMYRITRPGGRIFINGPDIDMWTFDAKDRETTRKIVHYICDHELSGWIGRQLPRLLEEAGWLDVKTVIATFPSPGFDLMCELYLNDFVNRAQKAGVVSRQATTAWLSDLRVVADRGLSPCTQTVFRVVGQKPGS